MTIGLTNGCFDLLHAGHLNTLKCASEKCDYLIVAVNTDDSVRLLKGEGRPAKALLDRIADLRAFAGGYIDAIIPFNGDAPALARAIKPHLVILGPDQYWASWSTGGWVFTHITEKLEGHSTTLQIQAAATKKAR